MINEISSLLGFEPRPIGLEIQAPPFSPKGPVRSESSRFWCYLYHFNEGAYKLLVYLLVLQGKRNEEFRIIR